MHGEGEEILGTSSLLQGRQGEDRMAQVVRFFSGTGQG